ncbi:hypothetical protein G6R40_02195 [Chryseobacterium sp. POL2]|uniref:hypothetical protein n=1 Tax=Chryseobacterium sp. POL2 TaxID=2713414 RepID=UPI0013E1F75D|nr:hypothetical protein [Chryseobacterium sp. POL2]QIG88543.1 hypothetical protein G6R40_02195 [Chryseobacterium sp. POL2]
MNKIIKLIIFSIVITACSNENSRKSVNTINVENIDKDYNVISTTKLVTANAKKTYSAKNRKNTQFELDIKSRKEKNENYKIKLSDKKILICDLNNNIIKEFSVKKKWTDETGPSTVYDLIDKNGTEYSLDHYVDYNKKDFLAFRFNKSLETYTNE